FWPDVRRAVDDFVSLAGANNPVASATGLCATGRCFPSAWQMASGSKLEAALNKVRTPKGPSYTSIYSLTDDLVQPVIPQSPAVIPGASNIEIQSVCPGRYVGHGGIVWDAVAVAAVLDAIEHRGPAKQSRIPLSTCLEYAAPGVNPAQATIADGSLYANAA